MPASSSPDLSVVMPVFNEAAHLAATIDALIIALERTGFSAELVVVDDGSTDGSGSVAVRAVGELLPVRVLRQANAGRLVARRLGLRHSTGELVLLLDARVRLEPDALRFLEGRVADGERVWTGHVHVDSDSPLGEFWSLLASLAWRGYFDDPRTTSFGLDDFDLFPKGAGCFLGPRETLLRAFDGFRSGYADPRHANDDTPLLRLVAKQGDIHVSPCFSSRYSPRESIGTFFRHSIHRGVVFLDGHGRPSSRYFPVTVVFYPLSAGLFAVSLRRPIVLPLAFAACGVGAALFGLRARRSRREARVLAFVAPVYAAGHALGMWKGLGLMVASRRRRLSEPLGTSK